jgi:hypothetical protein
MESLLRHIDFAVRCVRMLSTFSGDISRDRHSRSKGN